MYLENMLAIHKTSILNLILSLFMREAKQYFKMD